MTGSDQRADNAADPAPIAPPAVRIVEPPVLTSYKAEYFVDPGLPHPLGAVPDEFGVNFSVYAGRATGVELLLFDDHEETEPFQTIPLPPERHKTFHFWHVYVRGLAAGVHYAYRVDGQQDLHGHGDRYNPRKVLIDPYARGNTDTLWNRGAACSADDNVATAMRSVVIDPEGYHWDGDHPLRRSHADTVIYEMHVGGFTKSPTAGVQYPGTFAGVIEKIPYLQSLGITAVELLPVFQFDPQEVGRISPETGTPLANFWGYSTVGFFAPHHGYCVYPEYATHLREFCDMVKALHRAGIEVILDVVFNHTSEGNDAGPTISLRGFDNSVYYHLAPEDRQYYMNYSGCGNTVNCNHPIVEKLILECLECWVQEMHVDGFRFDEGSILARGEDGGPLVHPPVIWAIELSDMLADTKIIAEAWDAAGLYQIGSFPGVRWAEWNGRYRDDIRRFVRGDRGIVGVVASRIAGSADLYQTGGRLPINSTNFVNCHDGFTLNDLVSYNSKHNEANGEENHDGIDGNISWNCGVEGETDDPAIEALRDRQVKNVAAILMLSQGTPMFVAGDEVRRTQRGNNNAYCQDNAISWFDWDRVAQHGDIFRFFKEMIAFRLRHATLRRAQYFTGKDFNARGLADITWHGCALNGPGWDNPNSGVLAFTLGGDGDAPDLHVMLNMEDRDNDFALPSVPGRPWRCAIDTSLPTPEDIMESGAEPRVSGETYPAHARSVVVLIAR